MTKVNSREGQRAIAKRLASARGFHSFSTRKLRKLQCQVAITAMLNNWKIEQLANGDLKMRRG